MEGVTFYHLDCVSIGEYEGRGVVGPHINGRNDIETRVFKLLMFIQ